MIASHVGIPYSKIESCHDLPCGISTSSSQVSMLHRRRSLSNRLIKSMSLFECERNTFGLLRVYSMLFSIPMNYFFRQFLLQSRPTMSYTASCCERLLCGVLYSSALYKSLCTAL